MSLAEYTFWALIGVLIVGIGVIMYLTWPKPPDDDN